MMSENYRNGWQEIFKRSEKPMGRRDDDPIFVPEPEQEQKPKGKKTICPHCATKNLIQKNAWTKECLKCGWTD